jgi:hypothetical protein
MADSKKEPTPAVKAKEFTSTILEAVENAATILEQADLQEAHDLPAPKRGEIIVANDRLIAASIRLGESVRRL